MNKRYIILLSLLFPCLSFALSSDAEQPVELEADGVEINDTKGVSVYRGNVDIKQGSIHMQSDKLVIDHKNRKVSKFVANGNPVHFKQLPDNSKIYTKATAKKAEYYPQKNELVLTGNAVVSQGKDIFRSDRIVYDSAKGKVKAGKAAQGTERVKITIQPAALKK